MNPEKIKKIALVGVFLVLGSLVVWATLIGPAKTDLANTNKLIEKTEEDLRKSRALIQRVKNLKLQVEEASAKDETYFGQQPSGAPLAWLPPRLEAFFGRQGIRAVAKETRTPTPLDPNSDNLMVHSWTLDFKDADFIRFGSALAAFENAHPLYQVESIQVQSSGSTLGVQTISVRVTNVIRKAK